MLKKYLYLTLALLSSSSLMGASSSSDEVSTTVVPRSPVPGASAILLSDADTRSSSSSSTASFIDAFSDIKPHLFFSTPEEENKQCEKISKLSSLAKSDKLAWTKLLELANNQDLIASAHVGFMHVYGDTFTPKNIHLANKFTLQGIRWILEGSYYNNSLAQFYLAHLYETGIVLAHNFKASEELYIKSAKQGYVAAQLQLAVLYENGTFGRPNIKEADHWYAVAATNTSDSCAGQAQLRMGCKELESKKDIRMAAHWFSLAHKNGVSDATYLLAALHLKHGNILASNEQALEYATLAANAGCVDAMYLIGTIYAHGTIKSVPKNEVEAVKWIKAAHDTGHPEAKKLYEKYLKTKKF